MSSEKDMDIGKVAAEGGKVVFAPDVVATIANLAAADIKGVASLSSGVVDGISQMLGGRKSLTKGVKAEVGTQEAAIDVSIVVEYGFKIHEVCYEVQKAIKNAIETMTGLRVVEVNVYVQAINFEKPEKPAKEPKPPKEPKPEKEPEPPRVI